MAGAIPFYPIVNGNEVTIQRLSDSGNTGEETWQYNASINADIYTISGNTIVLVYAAGTITVNGTTYSETQTISLSNVDIVVTAKRQSPLSTTLTINYTE